MKIYYSASARGFFSSDLHATFPVDCEEITEEEHEALLAAQSAGSRIVPDARGRPVTRPGVPPEEGT